MWKAAPFSAPEFPIAMRPFVAQKCRSIPMLSTQLRRLRPYGVAFLDLLYTRRCEGCEKALSGERPGVAQWLCDPCLRDLPYVHPPYCNVCGETYETMPGDSFRCANCATLKLRFDFAVAACHAEGLPRELIHRFKYERQIHLAGLLGTLLTRTLEDERLAALPKDSWTLVPVPLHSVRLREREFNQSWELCKVMARRAGIPAVNALRRRKATQTQASLSRRERIGNIRGAFTLRWRWPWLRKRPLLPTPNVLLVDDVLTTGSTSSECARILRRRAGAQKVVVISVLRG